MATEAQIIANPLFSEELFSDTRLSQQPTHCPDGEINHFEAIMQNKPNLCVFWAVSGDCEEKQTQFKPNSNPIQTQSPRVKQEKFHALLSTALLSTFSGQRPAANPIKPNLSN